MALIKCSECGNEVSTTAKTCPKCGARVDVLANFINNKMSQKQRGVFYSIITLVVIIGSFWFYRKLHEKPIYSRGPIQNRRVSKPLPKREKTDSFTKEQNEKHLSDFKATLKVSEVNEEIFDSIDVKDRNLLLTMSNTWHFLPYQIRLQGAQDYFKAWKGVLSHEGSENAKMMMIDINGNEIGGIGVLGDVWVQEN